MKTLVKIETTYDGHSHEVKLEDIQEAISGIDLYCETSNKRFIDIVNKKVGEKDDYSYREVVEAIGYSQGDWQTYNIYHSEDDIDRLRTLLERTFTHNNDYLAYLYHYTEIDGVRYVAEDHFDSVLFDIDDIEFPSEEDIIKKYEEIEGKNYDELLILSKS